MDFQPSVNWAAVLLWRWEESHEKSNTTGMDEEHGGRTTARQRNDRSHSPQRAPWKAPQHADRRSGVSHDTACPAVPPFPGLITQLLLNLKCTGVGVLCSLIPLWFFSPSLLSACGRVCHTTGEQPQTVNADKINFLMLIPLEAEHTEGGGGTRNFSSSLLNWVWVHFTFETRLVSQLFSEFSRLTWNLNECFD